jgi:hypothetical protein
LGLRQLAVSAFRRFWGSSRNGKKHCVMPCPAQPSPVCVCGRAFFLVAFAMAPVGVVGQLLGLWLSLGLHACFVRNSSGEGVVILFYAYVGASSLVCWPCDMQLCYPTSRSIVAKGQAVRSRVCTQHLRSYTHFSAARRLQDCCYVWLSMDNLASHFSHWLAFCNEHVISDPRSPACSATTFDLCLKKGKGHGLIATLLCSMHNYALLMQFYVSVSLRGHLNCLPGGGGGGTLLAAISL